MTIECGGGMIFIECDKSRCTNSEHYDNNNFNEANSFFRDQGWRNRRCNDGSWENICPDCIEDEEKGNNIEDLK